MEQYQSNTKNYVESDALSTALPVGRNEAIIYPMGDCDKQERTPVMKSDETATNSYSSEQKVGDHHEYA